MSLQVGCPRCADPVIRSPEGWTCAGHGATPPLWRPTEATYGAFGEHLIASTGFPTYLPWPMSPGWQVGDFALVGSEPADVRATMTCSAGTSALDGPVEVVVVTEEPGTGLGARLAGLRHDDPGAELAARTDPPAVRVRVEGQSVALWPTSTDLVHGELDRSVLVGEAHGRWLWILLRPASALLLLREEWFLRDVGEAGPQLVEVPFGGPASPW